MFEAITGLPPFAVGVTAQGEVTAEDYETVLLPALKKATEEWKGVNLLLVMQTGLKDFTAAAWMEDAKTNIGYFLKWNKMAIVTDEKKLKKITRLFGFIIPGEAKTFSTNEIEAAKAWISVP